MASNVTAAGLKGVAGVVGSSPVLVADAVHSLADLFGDAVTYVALKASLKPPDDDHPYGHGKYEPLGTVLLSGMLVATGGGICWHAWEVLSQPAAYTAPISVLTAVALSSLLLKEGMYQATMRVARRHNSDILVANAWHHRSDALSSVVAFASLAGTHVTGLNIIDPIGSVLVAALILSSSTQTGLKAIHELLDRGPGTDAVAALTAPIATAPGVIKVTRVRARKMGPRLHVDAEILVASSITVSEGHKIAEGARQACLAAHPDVGEVTIHVDPNEHLLLTDPEPDANALPPSEELRALVRETVLSLGLVREVLHVDLHYLGDGSVETTLTIGVAPNISISQSRAVAASARRAVQARLPTLAGVDVHLQL